MLGGEVIVRVSPSSDKLNSKKTNRALEWNACDENPRSISETEVHLTDDARIELIGDLTLDVIGI